MLKSLAIGNIAEDEVMSHLHSMGFIAVKNSDKKRLMEFDVEATYNNISITFEVKNDAMASKTGNVAIEFFNSKKSKPSGLYATTSKWWVHKINGTLWIVKTKDLLDFTKSKSPARIIIGGGDANADIMLYKISDFIGICKPITEVSHEVLIGE